MSAAAAEWLIAELEPNFGEIFWSLSDPLHSEKKKNYQTAIAKLAALKKAVTRTPVMAELPDAQQRKTKINNRGNFLDLGDEEVASTVDFTLLLLEIPVESLVQERIDHFSTGLP